ncbi:hypothetical protein HADU_06649 [Acinetobacter sp. HA]|uniref:hypothetical protein n=1 Tax=Acinetobacter sp. HA TaxID=1173062 RepID=UPI000263E69F|nr:hypothetical protein [Acinetobacter sp. HA]EIM39505.1 hypothetical protein HADU_06649 [Acinetobacter sp. HA]
MQKAVFPIQSHADITKAINYMHTNYTQAINEGKPLRVVIDQKQSKRSEAQNKLYWLWVTQWAKHIGSDKDSEHIFFRRKFLARIFQRDDVGMYRETISVMNNLEQVLGLSEKQLYDKIANEMADKMSTTEANTKQFTEYLNDIHAFCNKHGCYLQTPDDLMYAWEMKHGEPNA